MNNYNAYSTNNPQRKWSNYASFPSEGISFFEETQTDLGIVRPTLLNSEARTIKNLARERIKSFPLANQQGYGYIMYDSYKLFNNKNCEFKIKPEEYWWHFLLSKLNNPLLKSVTTNRPIFSYIAAEAITAEVYKFLLKNPDAKDIIERINNSIKEGKKPNIDDMKTMTDMANRAANKAKNTMSQVSNNLPPGKSLDQVDLKFINMLLDKKMLNLIKINKQEIASFVKHIVNNANETCTGQKTIIEESLFEAEDIDDLLNIENFAHIALLQDLAVKTVKYSMNFDLYIDDSGSMYSRADLGRESKSMSNRQLSRAFAFKLYNLGLVKDIYLFSHQHTLRKIDITELFTAKIDGGTDIVQCIDNAKKIRRPAIILTDGEDYLSTSNYYNKIYFVCLGDSTNNTFSSYIRKKQYIFYSEGKLQKPIYSKNYERFHTKSCYS